MLDQLSLVRLRFELVSLETLEVPAYKGNLLRMALLWWLSEFWCPLADRCRNGCRRPETCTFGQLCEPPVNPAWSRQVRFLVGDTPPPAYALWDLRDRRTQFETGDRWCFELLLTGERALRELPAIVAAVQEGATRGMGRVRWHNRLCRVTAQVSAKDTAPAFAPVELCALEERDGQPTLVWQGYRLSNIQLGLAAAQPWVDTFPRPLRALRIDYLSPVKLKLRKQWVTEPNFNAVLRAVVRRMRILSEVHGAGAWEHATWGPLLDLAEQVRLEHHETQWISYERRSQQSGRYAVEGFVGSAWYSGADLAPLLPLLWLGQWLHIGKGYVLGNGRYALKRVGG